MSAFAYAGGVMPAARLQDADIVFDDMRDLPRLLEDAAGRNGGMRNSSMKKFGTPIGAGPGVASE